MSAPAESLLLKTPLHALHLELGAKMVSFGGYDMPVQYPAGVMAEHKHTRAEAGLFDVSHMGQVRLVGTNAAAALETLVPVDVIDLGLFKQRYALFTVSGQRRHLDTATAECEHGVHQELEGGHHGRHQTSLAQTAQ